MAHRTAPLEELAQIPTEERMAVHLGSRVAYRRLVVPHRVYGSGSGCFRIREVEEAVVDRTSVEAAGRTSVEVDHSQVGQSQAEGRRREVQVVPNRPLR